MDPLRGRVEEATRARDASVKAGINIVRPGASGDPIGEAPGVHDAPEVPGICWPQAGLTVLRGSAAVAIGVALFEALSP